MALAGTDAAAIAKTIRSVCAKVTPAPKEPAGEHVKVQVRSSNPARA